MKIVIDISEKNYMSCQTSEYARKSIYFDLVDAIRRSTILPKGHGDLIDRNKLINDGINKGFCEWYDEIKYAPVVIERDGD